MTELNDIYKKFGDKFCLCPFLGAFYSTVKVSTDENPTTTVTPCSLVNNSSKYNVQNNGILETLNSPVWIDLRQKFVQGKFHEIKDCRICIQSERDGGSSPRLGSAHHFVEHATSDLINEIQAIIDNDYQVSKVISLDYFPSNYCNYSCIMCAGAASSQRHSWYVKIKNDQTKIKLLTPDKDFYELLRKVEIINFTGGETVLQKQVLDLIDYLIQEDLAKNIAIFLLTNGSSFPDDLDQKFRKFRKVVYMVSIDGTNKISEYQRRNSDWNTVNQNAQKLIHHSFISTVVNYVLTAVNALNFMDFADWVYENSVEFIALSQVFQNNLSVAVFPEELRSLCLSRLEEGLSKYQSGDTKQHRDTARYIQQAINMVKQTPPRPDLLPEFIEHIRLEDTASKHTLVEIVPEWAPYFEVDQ